MDTPVKHTDAACGHIHTYTEVAVYPACYLLRKRDESWVLCSLLLKYRPERERDSGVQTGRKAGDWRGDHINKVEIIYF